MAGDRAIVVEPQQLDHVADVVLGFDPAGGIARLAGEDRVVVDPTLFVELRPQVLREAGVEGMVAVKMPDLATPKPEGELAATAGACVDPRPGRDLLGDPLACRS